MNSIKNYNNIKTLSPKLEKLKFLLQNSKVISLPKNTVFWANSVELNNQNKNLSDSKKYLIESKISRNLPLYLSLVKKPINLLFSTDQFVFEFSKKTYQQKKTGDFFRELKERKKLSLFYGHLNRKQLVNLFNQAKKNKGYFSKNVFSILERRLDVVLYRSALTKTLAEARQLIKHNKVFVNQQIINVPSYYLNSGDLISLSNKTVETLKNQIINSKKTQKVQNYPKIVGDFYSKVNKLVDSKDKFQKLLSKLFCKLLINLLCTRIKARSYWNLNLDKSYSSNINLEISQKVNLTSPNKIFLTKFKWKSCPNSKKKHFFQKVTPKNLRHYGSSRRKSNQEVIVYANRGSLQKKPLFWSQTFSHLNKKNSYTQSQQDFRDQGPNQTKISKLKNKNLVFYRKSFLVFLKHLNNYERFTNLITLSMKKFLFKNYRQNSKIENKLFFRNQRPLNFEVSYNLLNLVYLYSPQRVNFPFSIDVELIDKSLR